MARTVKQCIVFSLLILAVGRPSCALAMNQILNIRHWVAPDHTRVVIDTSDDTAYTVDKEERKLSINLEDTPLPVQLRQQTQLNKPGLEAITLLPRIGNGVRIELSLPGQVQTTVFKLKQFQDKPYRIVIDIVLPEIARQEKEEREKVKVTRKDRVVVIDPGHGGEAVGAVGKGGTLEKDVVLAIGRKLRDTLNGRPGYRAFLTRDGDYYVSFKKRLSIAREYGADLFVSIHADAARNRSATGSSVYCLSTRGASNAAASILARNENLADIVGGVSNGDSDDSSDPIILNMFQTHAMNQSRNFGANLLEKIKGVNRLKFATVQEAPFIVLKLPEIPSVLVETAYVSNPKEEKLLNSSPFQARMAESLARSIGEVIPPYPPARVIATAGKGEGRTENRQTERNGAEAKESKREARVPEDPVAVVLHQQQDSLAAPKGVEPSPVRETPAQAMAVSDAKQELTAGAKGVQEKSVAEAKEPKREIIIRKPPERVAVIASSKQEPSAALKGEQVKAAGEAKEPKKEEKVVLYRVKKGDTLDKIARKHGTSVAILAKLNGIDPRASLYVNRLLKTTGTPPTATTAPTSAKVTTKARSVKEKRQPEAAPVGGKGQAKAKDRGVTAKRQAEVKPGKATYRVKKGDNLEMIARKHGTTVQALAELNHLKSSAPLHVDRKLLLPERPLL